MNRLLVGSLIIRGDWLSAYIAHMGRDGSFTPLLTVLQLPGHRIMVLFALELTTRLQTPTPGQHRSLLAQSLSRQRKEAGRAPHIHLRHLGYMIALRADLIPGVAFKPYGVGANASSNPLRRLRTGVSKL